MPVGEFELPHLLRRGAVDSTFLDIEDNFCELKEPTAPVAIQGETSQEFAARMVTYTDELDKYRKATRADWSRSARALPCNATRLVPSEVLARLNATQSPQSRFFLTVCTDFPAAGKQDPLEELKNDHLNVSQMKPEAAPNTSRRLT